VTAQAIGKATVPFAFTVGHTVMPAGTYQISYVSPATFLLSDRTTLKSVTSLFRPEDVDSVDGRPRLVFHKYGDTYFLSQVVRGSGRSVIQLPTSNLEKEARIVLRNAPRNETVALK
jgi:hypothetical protein